MNDIYELLNRKGYARSARYASEHYFGKSSNYIAMGYGISEAAALTAVRTLIAEGRLLTALQALHIILFGQRDDEVAA